MHTNQERAMAARSEADSVRLGNIKHLILVPAQSALAAHDFKTAADLLEEGFKETNSFNYSAGRHDAWKLLSDFYNKHERGLNAAGFALRAGGNTAAAGGVTQPAPAPFQ